MKNAQKLFWGTLLLGAVLSLIALVIWKQRREEEPMQEEQSTSEIPKVEQKKVEIDHAIAMAKEQDQQAENSLFAPQQKEGATLVTPTAKNVLYIAAIAVATLGISAVVKFSPLPLPYVADSVQNDQDSNTAGLDLTESEDEEDEEKKGHKEYAW